MEPNASALYSAFSASDPRFDGHFFVGVAATKIYCRPVCCARRPKAQNCTFFISAVEAEQAGYRPCLLCRPEIAFASGFERLRRFSGAFKHQYRLTPTGLGRQMSKENRACMGILSCPLGYGPINQKLFVQWNRQSPS